MPSITRSMTRCNQQELATGTTSSLNLPDNSKACFVCFANFGINLPFRCPNLCQPRFYCNETCLNKDADHTCNNVYPNGWSAFAAKDIEERTTILKTTPIVTLPRVVDELDFDINKRLCNFKDVKIMACVGCHEIIFADSGGSSLELAAAAPKARIRRKREASESQALVPLSGPQTSLCSEIMRTLESGEANGIVSHTSDRPVACRNCRWPLCSERCHQKYHVDECGSLTRLMKKFPALERAIYTDTEASYLLHAIHRVWMLRNDKTNGRTGKSFFLFMELNELEFTTKDYVYYQQKLEPLMEYLKTLNMKTGTEWKILARIIAYRKNHCEISRDRHDYGIYPFKFSPSCTPNTELQFEDDQLVQKSVIPITKNEELTVGRYQWQIPGIAGPYTMSLKDRLLSPRNGDRVNKRPCCCTVCADGTSEVRIYLYRLKCKSLQYRGVCEGYVLPPAFSKIDPSWKCNTCLRVVDQKQIDQKCGRIEISMKSLETSKFEHPETRDVDKAYRKWFFLNGTDCPNYLLAKANLATVLQLFHSDEKTILTNDFKKRAMYFQIASHNLQVFYPGQHYAYWTLYCMRRIEKFHRIIPAKNRISKDTVQTMKNIGKLNSFAQQRFERTIYQLLEFQ